VPSLDPPGPIVGVLETVTRAPVGHSFIDATLILRGRIMMIEGKLRSRMEKVCLGGVQAHG